MPSLSFKKQFAPAVESGKKLQSIRKVRKRPIKVGDTLYLKTGMRTKHCRSLGVSTCCDVTAILLDLEWVMAGFTEWKKVLVARVGTEWLSARQTLRLARADGFPTSAAMAEWFAREHGLPFCGVVIKWSKPE